MLINTKLWQPINVATGVVDENWDVSLFTTGVSFLWSSLLPSLDLFT